jgi:hypothetical protein
VARIRRISGWSGARGAFDFLALVDPQAFQAWFGLSFAVTRVGRARSSRPTHSLCSVTPLAYSDEVSEQQNHHGTENTEGSDGVLIGLLAFDEVRFANGWPALKVLPMRALGRTALEGLGLRFEGADGFWSGREHSRRWNDISFRPSLNGSSD